MKTLARLAGHDQVTRHTSVRLCLRCLRAVMHNQVVDFDKVHGTKVYSWVATPHRCNPINRENRK